MQGININKKIVAILLPLIILTGAGFLYMSVNLSEGAEELEAEKEESLPPLIPSELLALPGEMLEHYERFIGDELEEKDPDPEKQVNILLLGLDNRGLSDAIMIVSYNNETFDSSIIALKRDTYVSFQDWAEEGSGYSALGWANFVGMGYGEGEYIDGAGYAAHVVGRLLGIEIDYYASITFDGFIELIDLIGGVTVNVPRGFEERSGQKLEPGLQHLSGEEALVFARHRKNPRIPEPGSPSEGGAVSEDGDRIRRNQRLLQAVLEQCKELETEELLEIYNRLDDNLYSNLDDWELLTMANMFYNRDPREMELVVLPGEIRKVHEEIIEQDIEYYFLDEEESDRILSELGLK